MRMFENLFLRMHMLKFDVSCYSQLKIQWFEKMIYNCIISDII